MNLSSVCFADSEIAAYIESLGSIGFCDVLQQEQSHVVDITELLDFFQELIDNLEADSDGVSMTSKIQTDWKLFATVENGIAIFEQLLPLLKTNIKDPQETVVYTYDIQENILYWEQLKEELKWEKRFLTDINYLTDELGWDGFFNTQYQLTGEALLYRARVHHESDQSNYAKEQMGCPDKQNVNGGRANSNGVPVLYLCDNKETILYEVRASYLDELTVGTFQLKAEGSIKIVDFTEMTSIFRLEKINETIKAKLLREEISKDLSKPMRRYDKEIEYIPTQFICEFIKVFTGAKGIRFQSSLHPKGKNIVIFEQELMHCVSVEKVTVSEISLSSK